MAGRYGLLKLLVLVWALTAAVCSQAASQPVEKTASLGLDQAAGSGVARFEGSVERYLVKVPVPARWRVSRARLNISFAHSVALKPERSKLFIRLDGQSVGQFALDPTTPTRRVSFPLQAGRLTSGYHDLEFVVAQNYTLDECSDPGSPELWTEIYLGDSTLEMDYASRQVPLDLERALSLCFDPRRPGTARVHLVVETLDEHTLENAALAACGAALRLQYRPLELTLSDTLRPGMDNILVGTPAFAHLVGRAEVPTGAAVSVARLPMMEGADEDDGQAEEAADPAHALFLVTGAEPAALASAARAFALPAHPMGRDSSALIRGVTVPEPGRYAVRNMIHPGTRVPLSSLGLSTTTFTPGDDRPVDVVVKLPSDALVKTNRRAVLGVDFAYASGLRDDSALNVLLNGEFLRAVPMSQEAGARVEEYRVEVPAYVFSRGVNTLTFAPVLVPRRATGCQPRAGESMTCTLRSSSWFEYPEVDHRIELPRLQALFADGFPLAGSPDFAGAALVLPGDHQQAAAALNLVAQISQNNGVPPLSLAVVAEPGPDEKRDLLVVETLGASKETGSARGTLSRAAWSLPGAKGLSLSWGERVEEFLFPDASRQTGVADNPVATIDLESRLAPGQAALVEFGSPLARDATVVLLTARSGHDLLSAAHALWDPGFSSRVRGGVSILDMAPKNVTSLPTGEKYWVGEIAGMGLPGDLVREHPFWFIGLVVVVLMVCGWIMLKVLRRRRDRRLGHE
jgi:hypothetical protein